MPGTKSILASRTVWAAAVTIAAALAGLLGYEVRADDQATAIDLLESLVQVWDRLVVLAGAAVALWGRIVAKDRLV